MKLERAIKKYENAVSVLADVNLEAANTMLAASLVACTDAILSHQGKNEEDSVTLHFPQIGKQITISEIDQSE